VRNGDDHTTRQVAILLCLYKAQNTIRGLADEMKVDKPVISRGVDRLVEDHFLERIPDPEDRRSVLVRLLPAGRRFIEEMTPV